MSYRVVALYKFATLEDFRDIREPLLDFCRARNVTGTLLLAREGINGTIAGDAGEIEAVLTYLRKDERLKDLEYKESLSEDNPFFRLKVKLKKEIVTLGVENVDPNQQVGDYVAAQDWNDLIKDPDVLLVDTRNGYEVGIGTFEGALNPATDSFRDFPEFVAERLDSAKHKKVAMFCTGGIRCEKASAYMLQQGFEQVYHLQGGILKYLEEIPKEESLWRGECFVFDRRVAVDHQLEPGSYEMCYACRRPISAVDKASIDYQEGISCPHCVNHTSAMDKERFAQRQNQIALARQEGRAHIGIPITEIERAKAEKAAKRKELRRNEIDNKEAQSK